MLGKWHYLNFSYELQSSESNNTFDQETLCLFVDYIVYIARMITPRHHSPVWIMCCHDRFLKLRKSEKQEDYEFLPIISQASKQVFWRHWITYNQWPVSPHLVLKHPRNWTGGDKPTIWPVRFFDVTTGYFNPWMHMEWEMYQSQILFFEQLKKWNLEDFSRKIRNAGKGFRKSKVVPDFR